MTESIIFNRNMCLRTPHSGILMMCTILISPATMSAVFETLLSTAALYFVQPYYTAPSSKISTRKRHPCGGHYSDVIMCAKVSQITGVSIVYPTVSSGADQRRHQSVTGLCEENSPVNSQHKGPVTRKMFSFDHVIGLTQENVQLHRVVLWSQ